MPKTLIFLLNRFSEARIQHCYHSKLTK